ncbi:MAG: LysR family transcriptional regulator [Romboutsia sp.]|uniref:LysR family transcriptional regulator n=1 Tax=Romboutsia sp. TaxID=1965302 RepID=UPI003F2BFEB5
MRISSLKYFYEVSELKSISKVSNNLHISQPALSHQLSKLEKELGVKLFERSNRGVELTEKGKILYNYAKEILNSHDNLLEELSQGEFEQEEIKISILSRYANFLIDSTAKDLGVIFKGMNVSISNQLEINNKSLLLHNRSDVIIGCNEIEDNDLVCEYIGNDRLILVSKKYVECNKLANLSIALLDDSLNNNTQRLENLYNRNIFLKTDSFDVIKSYLDIQGSAAIIPSISVENELKEGLLTHICGEQYEFEYNIYMTYRKDVDIGLKKKFRVLKRNLENILKKEVINRAI